MVEKLETRAFEGGRELTVTRLSPDEAAMHSFLIQLDEKVASGELKGYKVEILDGPNFIRGIMAARDSLEARRQNGLYGV